MAQLELETQWNLKVTTKELNIIRAALGGRLRLEDSEEAKLLDTNLSKQVVGRTKNQMDRISKLASHVDGE
jgi:hypothetical protein